MATTHTLANPDVAGMHARAELIAILNDDLRQHPVGPGNRTVVMTIMFKEEY